MGLRIFLAFLVFLMLTGCTAARKQVSDPQNQQLQNRIRQLQVEAQQKDKQISDLEYELETARLERAKAKETRVYREKEADKKKETEPAGMDAKNIQAALKKAGFYKGEIDGKIGKATKKAIVDFQSANGLAADGVAGKKTWEKLGKFLD